MTELISFTAFRQTSQLFFALFFFHCSEFLLAVYFHGIQKVSFSSLLISTDYALAMFCSLIEYSVELYFFPELKVHWLVSNTGLASVVLGETIRKLAIITAGKSFSHLIKRYIEEDHVLITHGLYKYIRHPSYCGFLIWSIGTQIMICNPVCTLAFAVVVWRFFQLRIPYEEFFLEAVLWFPVCGVCSTNTFWDPICKVMVLAYNCSSSLASTPYNFNWKHAQILNMISNSWAISF